MEERGEGGGGGGAEEERTVTINFKKGITYLERNHDCVCGRLDPDRCRPLLHSLHCVLELVQPALRRPGCDVIIVLIPKLLESIEKMNKKMKDGREQEV